MYFVKDLTTVPVYYKLRIHWNDNNDYHKSGIYCGLPGGEHFDDSMKHWT